MALLKSAKVSELPESQVEFREKNSPKRWLTLVVYIILALIVAFLVVLAARWVYHKVNNHNDSKTASSAQQQKTNTNAGANKNASKQPSASSSKSNNKSKSNAPGSSKATPPTAAGSLPNNGPGNVVALFVGSSTIAYGLHFAIRSRRFKA